MRWRCKCSISGKEFPRGCRVERHRRSLTSPSWYSGPAVEPAGERDLRGVEYRSCTYFGYIPCRFAHRGIECGAGYDGVDIHAVCRCTRINLPIPSRLGPHEERAFLSFVTTWHNIYAWRGSRVRRPWLVLVVATGFACCSLGRRWRDRFGGSWGCLVRSAGRELAIVAIVGKPLSRGSCLGFACLSERTRADPELAERADK